MSKDLFLIASRQKYRFPSSRGELPSEQLWDIPLLSTNGFCLNEIAVALNTELKSLEETSFVAPLVNPRREEISDMLEIVKTVIAVKQKEAKEKTEETVRAQKKEKIRDLIEQKRTEGLAASSIDELEAMLAQL